MLFISHLNQEDLCAITWKCFVSISVPQLHKISSKNPRGKTRTCRRDTFREVWNHRNWKRGGSPHVTDIPMNFLELDAMKNK